MNLLVHFLLTHFLSDYPFQPGSLVKLKMKRFKGVLIHTAVHLGSMLVILYPVLHEREVQIAIAVVYMSHTFIDQAKVKLDKNDPKHHRLYYFLGGVVDIVDEGNAPHYLLPAAPKAPEQIATANDPHKQCDSQYYGDNQ